MTIFFRSSENLSSLVKGESLPDRMSGNVVDLGTFFFGNLWNVHFHKETSFMTRG